MVMCGDYELYRWQANELNAWVKRSPSTSNHRHLVTILDHQASMLAHHQLNPTHYRQRRIMQQGDLHFLCFPAGLDSQIDEDR